MPASIKVIEVKETSPGKYAVNWVPFVSKGIGLSVTERDELIRKLRAQSAVFGTETIVQYR